MNEITEIPTADIKFFTRRARPEAGYARLKKSISELGLRVPIQVRSITHLPPAQRKSSSGHYRFQLIAGQGRLQAYRELRKDKIPAIILDVAESEIPGRFLTENILRRSLSWQEKAKLIKSDVDRIGRDLSKTEVQELADRYFITPAHVAKLLKILQQASPKIRTELDDLTIEEAHDLTSLPKAGQEIVIEAMKETGLERSQLTQVVKKAKEVSKEGGELSKTALKASLRRVDEDLKRVRESLKPVRLHHSLGPANLQTVLSDKNFRKAMDKAKINYQKFEEAVK